MIRPRRPSSSSRTSISARPLPTTSIMCIRRGNSRRSPQLGAGVSASADTPRLQAVATGQANGSLYLPSSNSSLNQVFGTLYGNGHGTIFPDLLFRRCPELDNAIHRPCPGFGFQNLSTLPRNQQTQQFINNVSPYLLKIVRRRWPTPSCGTASARRIMAAIPIVTTSPLVPGLNNLTSTTLNEGTFIAATGENFQQALARFTADASEFNFDIDGAKHSGQRLQRFRIPVYPDDRRARAGGVPEPALSVVRRRPHFAGATWLVGGRLGTVGPDQPAYVSLQYGKQQGVYGFTGAAQVNITPTMVFTANLVQGIASQGQLFQSNLANSTLSPSGGIVNQFTGLPIGLLQPGLGSVEQCLSPAPVQCRGDRLAGAELLFALTVSTMNSNR